MRQKILILFAHPALEKSTAHHILGRYVPKDENLTFHDLYEIYPEFNIDVQHEQTLLAGHDIIVWQHPIYWYSCPPLLKQWIDLVLEFGWAYGPGGTALEGKKLIQIVTTGGGREAYQLEGFHRHTLREFLLPFEQTAKLCKMDYLPPYVVHGTHRLNPEVLIQKGHAYEAFLQTLLAGELDVNALHKWDYSNEWQHALNPQYG